jgi:hypothetical protein
MVVEQPKAAHRHPHMIAGPPDVQRLLTEVALTVVPRRPHTVADQRLLTAVLPPDAQRPRTAVEVERHLVAVVVVTRAAADPAVVGTLPAAADTPVGVIRMEGATNKFVLLRRAAFGRRVFY